MGFLIENSSSLVWAIISASFLFFLHRTYRYDALKHIPISGPAFPLWGAIQLLYDAQSLVQAGYDLHKPSVFRLSTLSRWIVVITGAKHIEELRMVPEEVLSFGEAIDEILQISYTLGNQISTNPYHIPIIRSQLTKNLGNSFPVLHDEIVAACDDIVASKLKGHEWVEFRAMDTFRQVVCRASNSVFVGQPLCRNREYIDLAVDFTTNVVMTAAALNFLPPFMRPAAGKLLTSVPNNIRRTMKHLGPVIEDRRRKIAQHGKDWADKPADLLTWLMDKADGDEDERLLPSLTRRILVVNFAAIHTSSMAFVHALYYLAASPEYLQPLRDEIESIVGKQGEGWTKAALGEMHKVDSFLRESMRLNGQGSLSMYRKALEGFTFSDGTYIPKNTFVTVASTSTQLDAANYPNPLSFDPFRHVAGDNPTGRRRDLVLPGPDFLEFGSGRHVCPGRFFAADELKLLLAHVVVSYDIKLGEETGGQRPPNTWFAQACMPNLRGEVMLRKRVPGGDV